MLPEHDVKPMDTGRKRGGPRKGDVPPSVACEGCAETDWDVFYEKTSNVKAALAAILIGIFGVAVCPRVFYPHSQGAPFVGLGA
jgi:hypothetical protein